MTLNAYVVQSLNRSRPLLDSGMTPPHQRNRPADSPQSSLSWFRKAAVIGCAAMLVFGWGLFAKAFEDEYAYISQSYYADLFYAGRFDDRAWLDFLGYDLQPLPKYLVGLSLRVANLPMPTAKDASEWYRSYKSFGALATLIAARVPFVLLGVLGCVALLACGTIIDNYRVGAIAAIVLMLNPLYRVHAHRAMSDVPCEAFMFVAIAIDLWMMRRLWSGRPGVSVFFASLAAGICAGLSILCKFNGFLGLMIIAAWCGFAWFVPGLRVVRKLAMTAATMGAIAVAIVVSVALEPFSDRGPRGFWLPSLELCRKWVLGIAFVSRWIIVSRWLMVSSELSPTTLFSRSPKRPRSWSSRASAASALWVLLKIIQRYALTYARTGVRLLWVPLVFFGLVVTIRLGTRQLRTASRRQPSRLRSGPCWPGQW